MPAPDKFPSNSIAGLNDGSRLFPPSAGDVHGKTDSAAPVDPPGDMVERLEQMEKKIEALWNMQFTGGSNATVKKSMAGFLLNIRQPVAGNSGGGASARVIIFDYTPPTPDGPDAGDVTTAIELAYTSWPLIPQALDFLACNGLNYLVFPDQNFYGTIGADNWSIIFFVVGGVTYTAFSVGGAYTNSDGF
jgi:hypothetical protein